MNHSLFIAVRDVATMLLRQNGSNGILIQANVKPGRLDYKVKLHHPPDSAQKAGNAPKLLRTGDDGC
jgi:hypothetical protein